VVACGLIERLTDALRRSARVKQDLKSELRSLRDQYDDTTGNDVPTS
jgi:hypothetical protein